MKRFIAVLAIACAAVLVTGCGGTSSTPADAGAVKMEDLFPKDNDIAGWAQDTTADTKTGPTVFSDQADVDKTDIDGDVVPFNNVGFKALGREHFKKDTFKLDLRVWQMKDTAAGTKIYTDLPATPNSKYAALTWTDVAIGTAGRHANSGTMWRINSHKGPYFLEITIVTSEATDTATRDQGIDMLKFVANKIP